MSRTIAAALTAASLLFPRPYAQAAVRAETSRPGASRVVRTPHELGGFLAESFSPQSSEPLAAPVLSRDDVARVALEARQFLQTARGDVVAALDGEGRSLRLNDGLRSVSIALSGTADSSVPSMAPAQRDAFLKEFFDGAITLPDSAPALDFKEGRTRPASAELSPRPQVAERLPAEAARPAGPPAPSPARPAAAATSTGKTFLALALAADLAAHAALAYLLLPDLIPPALPGPAWAVHFSNWNYILANALGFFFVRPQLYTLLSHRAAGISLTTPLTGAAASALLVVTAAATGSVFLALQNIYGTISFLLVAGLYLKYRYFPSRARVDRGQARLFGFALDRSAMIGTSLLLGLTAAVSALAQYGFVSGTFTFASLLSATIHGWPLVPLLQTASALAFAYLLLPQWLKIRKDRSLKDADPFMTVVYFVACVGVTIWGFHAMFIPVGSIPAGLLGLLLLFTGALSAASLAALQGIAKLVDRIKPQGETRTAALAFAPLAAFMAAVIGLGYLSLDHLPGLPGDAAKVSEFATYLIYTVSNVLCVLSSALTLVAFWKYRPRKTAA